MKDLAEMHGTTTAHISRYVRGESRLKAGGPISKNNRGKDAAGRMLDGREWNEVPK